MSIIGEGRFTKTGSGETGESQVDVLGIDQGKYGSNITLLNTPDPIDMSHVYSLSLEENCVELIDGIVSEAIEVFCTENKGADKDLIEKSVFHIWQEMYHKSSGVIDSCDAITDHTTIEFDDIFVLGIIKDTLSNYNNKITVALKKKHKGASIK